MKEWISFEEFIIENSSTIIKWKVNIIKDKRMYDKIKKENMEIYRKGLKILQGKTLKIKER